MILEGPGLPGPYSPTGAWADGWAFRANYVVLIMSPDRSIECQDLVLSLRTICLRRCSHLVKAGICEQQRQVSKLKDGEQWDGELTQQKGKARLIRLQEVLVEGQVPVTVE